MSGGRALGLGSLRRDGKGRWVLTWRDSERRRRESILSEDKRTAERMRSDIIRKRDLALRGLGREEGQERPFEEIRDAFMVEAKATRATATWTRLEMELDAAVAFLGPRRVRDVTCSAVMEWRRKRMEPKPPKRPGEKELPGVSVRTANMGGAVLKACLEWARRAGLITANPLVDLRPIANPEATWRKRRRALSEAEVGLFLHGAEALDAKRAAHWAAERTIAAGTKGEDWNARSRSRPIPSAPLWRTFVSVGLRLGEAIAAKWEDYDDAERVLYLRPATTKTRRSREVPVPQELATDLAALRTAQALARGRPVLASDPIFPTPHGDLWDAANVRRDFRSVLKLAGMTDRDERGRSLDVHALRATATTRMLRHGVALPIVMSIVGHTDSKVTLRHYTDLRLADTRAALDTMPAAKASAGEERMKAAVGSEQTAAKWRADSADDDESPRFPRRSRPDSNGRPAVPKVGPSERGYADGNGDQRPSAIDDADARLAFE